MPFGMSCAGATFMRLMRNVLQGAEEYCDSYIDDIVIHSDTFDQHYEPLKDVIERLTKAGLTAKPSKCSVGECQSRYLGYIIGNGQINPAVAKIRAVSEFPRPVTKKDVRAFLGLCGYYRRFVVSFVELNL